MTQRGHLRRQGKAWRLVLRRSAEPGRPRRRVSIRLGSVTELRSRAEARQAADRLLAQIEPEQLHAGRRVPWSNWCRQYIDRELPLVSRGTRTTKRSIVTRHLVEAFGARAVHEIGAAQVQTWITDQALAGASPGSIRARFSALRRVINAARAAGLTTQPITAASVRFPPECKPRASVTSKAFSADEARRILEAATGPDHVAFSVMAYVGLRPSECLGLQWQHVDLELGRLHVRQQCIDRQVRVLKSKTSVAVLTMPNALRRTLEAYRATTDAEPHQFLFHDEAGRPWLTAALRARQHALLDQLVIARRGLHAWRHRCAVSLAEAGCSPEVIRRCLRHSSLAVTAQYLDAADADVRDGFERGATLAQQAMRPPQETGQQNTSSVVR